MILATNGYKYEGFEAFTVASGLNYACSSFMFKTSEKFELQKSCEIYIEGEKVLTGTIEKGSFDFATQSRIYYGRSKTSAIFSSAVGDQITNQNILQIAQSLCSNVGVNVICSSPGDNFPEFHIQQGESIFNAIFRIARLRGLTITDDTDGNLIILKVEESTPEVIFNELNIKGGIFTEDYTNRYSSYTVYGQSSGDDYWNGENCLNAEGYIADSEILSTKPFIHVADGQIDQEKAQTQAEYLKKKHVAESFNFPLEVYGYKSASGLIKKNTVCSLETDELTDDMIISDITYKRDNKNGSYSMLNLERIEAYVC